jgi:hypothetical protein
VFTVADRSAVEHGGAEGVLGGVAGVVAPVVGGALEAAEEAEDAAVAGVDAWPTAALPPLVVDPQAAARAPVHSRTAAVLIRRAAWADDVMGRFPCRGGAASRTPGVS